MYTASNPEKGFRKKALEATIMKRGVLKAIYLSICRLTGRNWVISADSSNLRKNPFYKAFKINSFTGNDITLNFIILDILKIHKKLSLSEINELIDRYYLSYFKSPVVLDIATVNVCFM